MLYPTVHPVLLYHGQDGQYDRIQLSIYICFILLSILSYCTMDKMDGTMESNCLYTYALSYCPSCPIVPWTGWTVQWNPTVYIHMLYPTVHPVLLYHGQDGQYDGIQLSMHMRYPVVHPILLYHGQDGCMMESNCIYTYVLSYCPSRPIVLWTGWMYDGIQLYIYICFIQLSIPSYYTMDRIDGTMESNCLCICVILLSIPSYCTMDRMDGTMESNCIYTYVLSCCPSHPIVPWTGWMYDGIQLYIYICFILLSIPSYCTMDRMDGTMESNCIYTYICFILLSIPSYCTMDKMDSDNRWTPTVHSILFQAFMIL